ncbi:MAG: sulfite exporter TauE/SafE family protein [Actinomycetota bacterium]|nr:sulfite exporter TauE/SafE family protein [Actinomycetota bacterium]
MLAAAALLVGFAKTAVGGVAAISVALFAAVLPARASTGALLPLLLVGDVVAVGTYRRHADWATLLRLSPSVAVGVVVGAAFVARVDDTVMRRTIGIVLLALLGIRLVQRRWARPGPGPGPGAAAFGLLAGFTTMVANSGGAVMSLYLLSARLGVLGFLGTSAWFFFLVNLFKLPFAAGLGLVSADSLALGAVLAPAVLLGAAVGRAVIARLDAGRFEQVVLVVTAATSLNLLR